MHSPPTAGTLTRVAFCCVLAACVLTSHARAGDHVDIKKVLVLFPEEAWSAPAYRTVYHAIKSVFDEDPRRHIILFGDSLDLYLFPDEVDRRGLAEFFKNKYAEMKIDLVIPVGPASLEFVLRNRDSMFPGKEIVFCAEVASGADRSAPRGDITGAALTVDIAGTIELARRLHPDLKRIAVVAGTGLTDRFLTSLFKRAFEAYEGKLELLDLTGLPIDDLMQRVSRLPDATVILYLTLQKDGDGRVFSSSATQRLVSQSANVPLYNLVDTALGYGSVGGRMIQLDACSRAAAEIALRVLGGEKPAAIAPVVIRHNPAMFDWREMKRWGIDESALPPGSIVRFREASQWETHRWWVIGAFSFICLQTLLIALLMNNLDKRKRAEAGLARSEANLKRAQEIASLGSLRYDLDKDTVNWSAGANEIFGLPPDSQLSLDAFVNIVHPDDREFIGRKWRAALAGDAYDVEHRIRVGDTVRWVRAKFEVEFDKGGRPISATGIVQDITPRKRSEEESAMFRRQLAHVSRVSTVGELGQNLAHEINQPLTAIQANAEAARELLAGERPDLAEARAALDDIVADNKRAQEVIRRIRSLVQNTPQVHSRVDLNRVAAESVQMSQTDAGSKGVAIRLDLGSDIPAVLGDEVQLQQVALNLIINAMEAVSQSQSAPRLVTVKTAGDGDGSVSLCVSDTGPGIDRLAAERLFEPFFTTKPQGMGLGLSISRTIVEAHGGSLSLDSRSEQGACFCCRFPALAAEAPHQTAGGMDHGA
jgi:PAS domain S-box-containing protein